jgi:hypothetical protein
MLIQWLSLLVSILHLPTYGAPDAPISKSFYAHLIFDFARLLTWWINLIKGAINVREAEWISVVLWTLPAYHTAVFSSIGREKGKRWAGKVSSILCVVWFLKTLFTDIQEHFSINRIRIATIIAVSISLFIPSLYQALAAWLKGYPGAYTESGDCGPLVVIMMYGRLGCRREYCLEDCAKFADSLGNTAAGFPPLSTLIETL